jgi:putative transposase
MPNYLRAFCARRILVLHRQSIGPRRRLLTNHIDALREATRLTQTRHPFTFDAMVVLPDHIHAVWTLPPGDADFSLRWRLIKIDFAEAVPNTEPRSPVRIARGERGIWQRRFWEHLIRDDEDFRRHIEYCYINPVKHGLVTRVRDWPHSSPTATCGRNCFPRIGLATCWWRAASASVFEMERRNALRLLRPTALEVGELLGLGIEGDDIVRRQRLDWALSVDVEGHGAAEQRHRRRLS